MANTKQGGAGNIIKLALVLLAVAAVIALVLGFVNAITEGPIKAYNDNKTAEAYANVMEGYNGDTAEVLYDVNDAATADVHAVIEHVQDEVDRQFGVRLEPEVRFLG